MYIKAFLSPPTTTAIAVAGQRTLAVILLLAFLPLSASAATILYELTSNQPVGYVCETMTVGEPDINSQTWSSSGGITLSNHTGFIVEATCMLGAQSGTVSTTITYVDGTFDEMSKGLDCDLQGSTPCFIDCNPINPFSESSDQ